MQDWNHSVDIPFAVDFTHRLRFTTDVFGRNENVLLDLFERADAQPVRVQFWLDQEVAEARPDLAKKLRDFGACHSTLMRPSGNVQIVPGGEVVKNDIHILERMLKVMHHADLDRRSYVIAIGGGAVLDAVGFAAAIAHRGIRLIRLPTTTLAQADSGIGVKNSVNLFQKKNWIGTFAVPWGVINDTDMLATLPDREFVCGLSEAVKVALLKDARFFDRICSNAERIRNRDMVAAAPVIAESARQHLLHITRGGDPFESLEARPLDFGHWSAHKLEVLSDFNLRHGEAVAIGVAVDTVYSSLVYGLAEAAAERVLCCLTELGMHLDHPAIHERQALFAGLEEFRQHLGGRLTLTMLSDIGDPLDVHEVDRDRMCEAMDYVAGFARRSRPRVTE